jgi:hypothetical protein
VLAGVVRYAPAIGHVDSVQATVHGGADAGFRQKDGDAAQVV